MRKLKRNKPTAEKKSWKVRLNNGQTLTVEAEKVLVSNGTEPYLFYNGEIMRDLCMVVPAANVAWVRKV